MQTPLTAFVEQPLGLGFRRGLKEIPVLFATDNQSIGVSPTRRNGQSRTLLDASEAGCAQFEAVARVKGKVLETSGSVFQWNPARTIIVVDIDETLSITDYLDLLFTTHDSGSRPIRGALETMTALSKDYQIAYLTSRPRFMLSRTRRWLREQGFPAGPVLGSANWGEWRKQGEFKHETLAGLRRQWPNLLIGIGDKSSDATAYLGNNMLTLIVNTDDDDEYDGQAVVLRNWPALAAFFARNRAVLSKPSLLAARIGPDGRLSSTPAPTLTRRPPSTSQRSWALGTASDGPQLR